EEGRSRNAPALFSWPPRRSARSQTLFDNCRASGMKKPAAGDTSQRAFTLSQERTFPPRNAFKMSLRLAAAPLEWDQMTPLAGGRQPSERRKAALLGLNVDKLRRWHGYYHRSY